MYGGFITPPDERLVDIYGATLSAPGTPGDSLHRRDITVFSDGEVDRSPCDPSTTERVALLANAPRTGSRPAVRAAARAKMSAS